MSSEAAGDDGWLTLQPRLGEAQRTLLLAFADQLAALPPTVPNAVAKVRTLLARQHGERDMHACALVLRDLWRQGWAIRVVDSQLEVRQPGASGSAHIEKLRVRAQLSVARDEQLSSAPVREFVRGMETRRSHGGDLVSIFSLMRDGAELSTRLEAIRAIVEPAARVVALSQLIQPYLQVVQAEAVCEQTGLRLLDVWRYFRHTWSSPHRSVPGRTMMVLVRDAAAPHHPVIGIAALSSAAVQIRVRDTWIGWEADSLVDRLRKSATDGDAEWLSRLAESALKELYVEDLLEDGVLTDAELDAPSDDTLARLRSVARSARTAHVEHDDAARTHKAEGAGTTMEWIKRARLSLFRSKRADVLATVLRARKALRHDATGRLTGHALQAVLASEEGRQAARGILRRAKSERVGTAIADITVCGAVAPYSAVLGGKLVAMLLASEELRDAYRQRYAGTPSLIASSLAGRPVVRDAELVLLCTTSLYGSGSSQYNRLRMDAGRAGGTPGDEIVYDCLGKTQGFGTGHLAEDTLAALAEVGEAAQGPRVRGIFGEGVSPRLRKARGGLDVLGLVEADSARRTTIPRDLLHHGAQRIVYGVALADNFREYLLGRAERPMYRLRGLGSLESTKRIVAWWTERWLSPRVARPEVLANVTMHETQYPVRHGARVDLPEKEPRQLSMFE